MKVYELINELSKAAAGAEVLISLPNCENVKATECDDETGNGYDGPFVIYGEEPELTDELGEVLGMVSEIIKKA